MSLCVFSYHDNADGTFSAVCGSCGRSVRASNTAVIAACKASDDYKKTHGDLIATLTGAGGPGTELHAILRDWLGIEPTADCPCHSMAAKMDRLGPDWCEGDGMPEILGVMQGEHAKRWSDGRTRLPWSDLAARQLVKLACRRARAKASA